MTARIHENQPWYRIPIVWLVIGIPLLSVVVTLSIVWISIVTFDGLVVDDYYKKGLEINRDLTRDQNARDINLNALVGIEEGLISLELRADKFNEFPSQLRLGFYHPTLANRDVIVKLERLSAGRYEGSFQELTAGKWRVAIGAEKWRLEGIVYYPRSTSVELRPAKVR